MNVVSTTGAMQPCIRPMIVARDAAASLACLGAEVGNTNSFELRLFHMDLLNPGSDRFISRVHPQCRSRADVAVIRDNAFITAECLEGEGWPVFAFEGERDDASRAPTGGPISDKPTNPTQPQAAATLRNTQPRYWLYGWPTNEFFPYGSGPPYVSVFLDE